jgi:methyl-accepting chemotaxis protein
VTEVSKSMTTIAAAVEEQSVTMRSISHTAEELRSISQS